MASRKLGSNTWQKTTLPNKLHWDSHNYVVMGFDEEGKSKGIIRSTGLKPRFLTRLHDVGVDVPSEVFAKEM